MMQSDECHLAGRRVLVVEDEAMVTMLLREMLKDIGCEVVGSASRLNDAIEKATSLSFDLAILDVNLNGERTFQVADLLAARGVGFVFATGYGGGSVPASCGKRPSHLKSLQQEDLDR